MKTFIHIVIQNENKIHNTQQGDKKKKGAVTVTLQAFSPAYPQGFHED